MQLVFLAAELQRLRWMCEGHERTEHTKTEEKEREKATEQSRSQAAGKDHLGARCVSFVSSPLQLSCLSTTWHCSYPYANMAYIQTDENVLNRSTGGICYQRTKLTPLACHRTVFYSPGWHTSESWAAAAKHKGRANKNSCHFSCEMLSVPTPSKFNNNKKK